jgi:dTDP-4-dehydrorhamnose reductase
MRILVVGASGMVGSAMVRVLSAKAEFEVSGTVRSPSVKTLFPGKIAERLIAGVEAEKQESLARVFEQVRPQLVINCAGLTKHRESAEDPLQAMQINALMPHQLACLCAVHGARLIQISTDCVFSGEQGSYSESDLSDAKDVYGKSKFLGEVYYEHTLTIRTSFIGHELQTAYSLLEWFLLQGARCKGFTRAIFSGLPTVTFAQLIRDVVIPRADLYGLYHVASQPISKYDLLHTIARVYGKQIEIVPDATLVVDRSLTAARFQQATGYIAPDWSELVQNMYSYH